MKDQPLWTAGDDTLAASRNPKSEGDRELRQALAAQRDRAIAYGLSLLTAVPASLVGVLTLRYRPSLVLFALGLASTLFFARLARRQRRRTGHVRLVGWWMAADVLLITAMVPCTGGVESPWWIWYLASIGTAVAQRGRRYAAVAAAGMGAMYFGVLVLSGEIRGIDHAFFLGSSRLVFLAAAATPLLLNVVRMRETATLVRRLKDAAAEAAAEATMANEELQRAADMLRDLSLTDALTGLRNRRYLTERVADEAARRATWTGSERRGRGAPLGCGFVLLDLDHFKPINDTYGHAAGDAALQHVARVLRGAARTEDTVARLGGDEFAVFVPQIACEHLPAMAEKIAAALRTQPARLTPGTTQMLSFSIGWSFVGAAQREEGVAAFDAAMEAADAALYAAKQAGRNCIRGDAASVAQASLVAAQ